MASIRGRLEWDDDDLTPGKKKEGGLHSNLYDDAGDLKSSARFVPDDEDRPSVDDDTPSQVYVYVTHEEVESRDALEEFNRLLESVIQLVELGVVVAPHVKRIWEKAHPLITSRWANRPRPRRGRPQLSSGDPVAAVDAEVVDSSRELVAAAEAYRINMSSSEAQARYLLALAARAYSDEQMRLLANALIEDDDGFTQFQRAVAQLPPQQIERVIAEFEEKPAQFVRGTADLGVIFKGSTRPPWSSH